MADRPTEGENNHNGSNSYTAQDIQVLKGLEAVRRRPGMYIGSTDHTGLHHLIFEIVYNSIDEAMEGWCTRIDVTIQEGGKVRVEDNGRGIPVDIHPQTGVSALETVMTILHAGAKFGGKTYRVSSGLHGVGASVVNALSSYMKVVSERDETRYVQEYDCGVPRGPVKPDGVAEGHGTITEFIPDKNIFGDWEYDFDYVAQRLRELAYLQTNVQIGIHDDRTGQDSAFYFEGGIASYVRYLNRSRTQIHPGVIYMNKQVDSTSVEAAMQYNDGYNELIVSFANCANTIDGGSHLTGFRSALTRVLNDFVHKIKQEKGAELNLLGEDVRGGLTAVVSVRLNEPQFEGQTKGRLGNPETRGYVESVVADQLSFYLEQHPNEARAIIEKCLTSAKAREAARRARELILKKGQFEGFTLPGKLAECAEKDPAQCELFIVEGDSAGGSAKQGRDRKFQAILPLKGKILNVEKASYDKMLSHEEIRALITSLGAGIADQFDVAKLRYHRVIIMTDADVDGSHIRTLLLTFFFRHMHDVIWQGYLYIAQPPLYRVQGGKEQHWIYSDKDKDDLVRKLKAKKVEVQRYKGLGEMSPEQLWETTMNPATRTMLQVKIEDAARADEVFRMLMGEEVPPRKAFIQAHAKSVRNLDI